APEACRKEQDRQLRRARWALWLLPLTPFLLFAPCYALIWWLGFPVELAPEIATAERLLLLNLCLVTPAFWLYDLLYVRRMGRKLFSPSTPHQKKGKWWEPFSV